MMYMLSIVDVVDDVDDDVDNVYYLDEVDRKIA